MKKILTFVVACCLITPAIAQTAAPTESAASLHKKGVAAEKAGDPAAASSFYSAALKADPNSADARYSLAQLKINYASVAAKGREAKFGAVMVPVYQLDQANLQESLDALARIVEKESKNQVTPNFVIEDPKQVLASNNISLNLKNMPAAGVMKYLLEQVGAKARYDEHAIVIVAK